MGLLKCVDCGLMVSDKADKCPQCGCPIKYIIQANQKVALQITKDRQQKNCSASHENNSKRCEDTGTYLDGLLNDISAYWVYMPDNGLYGRGQIVECLMDHGPIIKIEFEGDGVKQFGKDAIGKSVFVKSSAMDNDTKHLKELVNDYFYRAYNFKTVQIQPSSNEAQQQKKKFTPAIILDLQYKSRVGDKNAIYNMGMAYKEGNGVAQNTLLALEMFEKAGSMGHMKAMREAAMCYKERNMEQMYLYWKKKYDNAQN